MEVLLEENPFNPWYKQPRRHKWAALKGRYGRSWKSHRNPFGGETLNPRRARNPIAGALGGLTQGVDVMDGVAAVAGLAAATMLPGVIIKSPTGNKFLKVAIAFGAAFGVSMLMRKFVSSKAGNAAIMGGIAGAGVQLLNTVRPGTIGGELGSGPVRFIGAGGRIGDARLVSPSMSREGENVSLIQP